MRGRVVLQEANPVPQPFVSVSYLLLQTTAPPHSMPHPQIPKCDCQIIYLQSAAVVSHISRHYSSISNSNNRMIIRLVHDRPSTLFSSITWTRFLRILLHSYANKFIGRILIILVCGGSCLNETSSQGLLSFLVENSDGMDPTSQFITFGGRSTLYGWLRLGWSPFRLLQSGLASPRWSGSWSFLPGRFSIH